ncbi:hybrid sensor histidine kinase/response regulator [Collimonas silvisoli]|uniref:hybrid sensor histidine kinase/response regulator n=1 Tax=Collimonas silvisoli TaxID=2825884 RepID=UPI001B8C7337|nr:response regulator [Collimonas silvisoli]
MSTKEDEFFMQLRATFRIEAAEHLQLIANGLLELERTREIKAQRSLVEAMFRAAHSLKGAARAADFSEIESRCQSLEDMFAGWKRQENVLAPAAFDAAHLTLNAISINLSAPELAGAVRAPIAEHAFGPPDRRPAVSPDASAPAVAPLPGTAKPAFSSEGSVRIAVAKLDMQMTEAEEMLAVKLTTVQRAQDLRELTQRFGAWKNQWAALEPEVRALRQTTDRPLPGRTGYPAGLGTVRMLEFLDWNLAYIKSLESKVAGLTRTADHDRHVVGKLVDDLLEDSKKLLLLPFATLAAPFPKLVRDLCRDQRKEANLVIRGEQVEIDKRILEEMKDPLMHLLRNCVDHGIETAETRVRLGKPARATITLAVSSMNDSKIELLVSDDGAGIDTSKVRHAAIEHGYLSEQQARQLGDAELQAQIFQAEVSTSPIITRLSGRGLGLAIVRERAEKLGGTVSVESRPQQGSSFRITLPSMLTTFRGILIESARRLFIVPTFHVERVARLKADDIQTVEGRETISLDGRAVALARLADVLELPPAQRNDNDKAGALIPITIQVMVLGTAEQHIAFAVDAVLDEQEVLVKPLRKPLSRVRHIAGVTVLGTGQVAPVLNVADLLKSAIKIGNAAVVNKKAAPVKAILVAENSITSRMLIKNILESAGYTVATAVDGMEAFTLLRSEKFDLLVSDVEMPRLNGFDLTTRIRADKKLTELPVVLVTALDMREDRERGIDVGANAYLVKSSFDQSNLLEAVRRLI